MELRGAVTGPLADLALPALLGAEQGHTYKVIDSDGLFLCQGMGVRHHGSPYGGFEQVGGLGTTLPSNDVNTTTDPGDIVLYSSSNIVVFFGSNSWAYTRLGHIEGKSDGELRDLLGENNAVLTFIAE